MAKKNIKVSGSSFFVNKVLKKSILACVCAYPLLTVKHGYKLVNTYFSVIFGIAICTGSDDYTDVSSNKMKLQLMILWLLALSCTENQDSNNIKKVNVGENAKGEESIKSNIDSIGTPQTIDEALSYFLTEWSDKEKNQFKNEPEDMAVSELHHSVGMYIRNNWIRHGSGKELLRNEFKKLGIFHPDDISSIILTSLHRKLNNIPINIHSQIKPYIQYWNEIKDGEELADKVAIQTYNKFDVGDSIKIYMYVDTMDGQRSACKIESKNGWTFNPKKDLLISGILKKKYFVEDKTSSFFIVRILNMNFKNTTVMLENITINKDHEFLIRNLRIE